jgi:hypothetical protein
MESFDYRTFGKNELPIALSARAVSKTPKLVEI